jgi:hypothetical protein
MEFPKGSMCGQVNESNCALDDSSLTLPNHLHNLLHFLSAKSLPPLSPKMESPYNSEEDDDYVPTGGWWCSK